MKQLAALLLISLLTACNHSPKPNPMLPDSNTPPEIKGYKLVWNEEFNYTGKPNPDYWSYEHGFLRNDELQWYQNNNANCNGQVLQIEARREKLQNPDYDPESHNETTLREFAEYTSASILTRGKQSWKYGRFEIRARIPVAKGSWPAIWTLGVDREWPSNGEIDLMEFYLKDDVPCILANAAWGTETRWNAEWDSTHKPLSEFIEETNDPKWADKFHIWRMDWNKNAIELYLDDVLLNKIELSKTINPDGFNPFQQEHYLLLNLAIGKNGGDPSKTEFPLTYEVDYVRIYQKTQD